MGAWPEGYLVFLLQTVSGLCFKCEVLKGMFPGGLGTHQARYPLNRCRLLPLASAEREEREREMAFAEELSVQRKRLRGLPLTYFRSAFGRFGDVLHRCPECGRLRRPRASRPRPVSQREKKGPRGRAFYRRVVDKSRWLRLSPLSCRPPKPDIRPRGRGLDRRLLFLGCPSHRDLSIPSATKRFEQKGIVSSLAHHSCYGRLPCGDVVARLDGGWHGIG
jgi:hypothetical protein